MPRLAPTTVMTLGRLYQGDLPPAYRTDFLNPPRTTPEYPQNLLRQAVMNGVRGIGAVGLGMMSPTGSAGPMEQAQYADAEAVAASAQATSQGTDDAYVPAAAASGAKAMWRPTPLWYGLATVSSLASVYHGYKRTQSVGWALVWGLAGTVAPLVTPVVAIAQGFAKPKRGR